MPSHDRVDLLTSQAPLSDAATRRLSRRAFLTCGVALLALAALPGALRAEPEAPQPFSFDLLTEAARLRAAEPDQPKPDADPVLQKLDYDAYQQIAFRPERAVWEGEVPGWQMQAFHTGWLFDRPVQLHEVVGDQESLLEFSSADFDYRHEVKDLIPEGFKLPGVAGFKLTHPLNAADQQDEIAAFLGASYFRALGRGNRYGLSARGIAIDSGLPQPEEFPRFSEFWMQRPAGNGAPLTLWASLDSARLTGAYQFVIRPGAVTEVEVTARLFFRESVTEIGIAPLTSMFLFGPINRHGFDDYRPQVHDSDGLRIVREDGDVIWRALSNPKELATSYFAETRPRSFGLHQRSRAFEDFQDPFARYDLRPSLDVVPLGDWGSGKVRLFELPTTLEIHDNVGAFWVPGQQPTPGEVFEISYLLRWGDLTSELAGDLAYIADTFSGVGGAAGIDPPPDIRKFVIDFEGGLLADAAGDDANIKPVVTVNGGETKFVALEKLAESNRWRLNLDLVAPKGALVEITAHIAGYGRKLSEIWSFQWKKV